MILSETKTPFPTSSNLYFLVGLTDFQGVGFPITFGWHKFIKFVPHTLCGGNLKLNMSPSPSTRAIRARAFVVVE